MIKVIKYSLLGLLIFFSLIFIIYLSSGVKKGAPADSDPRGAPSPTKKEFRSERIISAALLPDCRIKVSTNFREFYIETSVFRLGTKRDCETKSVGSFSYSGKYLAFDSVSGGVDSEVRIFSLELERDVSLDVLGSSAISEVKFLLFDKLAVLNGYYGYFGKDYLGQYLRVYDLPVLLKAYRPEKDGDLSSRLNEETLRTVSLPDVGRDYRKIEVSGPRFDVLDERGKRLKTFESRDLSEVF